MNTEGSKLPCRLGILGASAIAGPALLDPARDVPSVTVHAIANRTLSKAVRLAETYHIPKIATHLDELLDMEELDAVYIALSNELHAEWAIKALDAGKHVLVEKPIALNPDEADRLRQAKLRNPATRLVEGLMVAHHPWQEALKSIVESGQYGQLHHIRTRISIPARDRHSGNYRSVKHRGGGVFADLGCYWLQFVQRLAGLDCTDISAQSDFDGPDGCDWTFQAELGYGSKMKAECLFSYDLPYRASHALYFDQTVLLVPDFLRAIKGFFKMKIRHDLPHDRSTVVEFAPMHYYVNQLQAFTEVISGARAEEYEKALKRVELQSAILAAAEQGSGCR
ncbi:Gfo/Idh/MocA family protein [Paenibacillus macerans]|uniref:Gfo/Idh/MocA family protein n=1 Tax=Paenibacillus macerans TaxID=44252 RepID=UPI00203C848B|nr:Gfo/Idh/MocA family oxidoreductase [Paenibacillus macerans]MCM3701470.1 Gfo/Idh/MocA family oxidoreductase [Paenibacillus macerans]